jgi:Tfp pilus assembly protein PilN
VIRTNLATRPFYNERAVHSILLIIGLLAVAATAFNVIRVVQLSRRDTRLVTQAARDEATAIDLRTKAARLRATVDPRVLETASADARQANELIDRRTFSWIDLFNRLETTLPDDVRITAIRPKLDPKRGTVLTIIVAARSVEEINMFIANLDATGAFTELEKRDEQIDEQNQLLASLQAVYTPTAARAAEGAEPVAARPAEGAGPAPARPAEGTQR